VYQVLVNMLDEVEGDDDWGGGVTALRRSGLPRDAYSTHGMELELYVPSTAGQADVGMHCLLVYNRQLFSESTASRLAGGLASALARVAVSADVGLADIPVVPSGDDNLATVGEMAFTANQAQVHAASMRCVHELVDEGCRISPEKVAITCGGAAMTFAQLRAKSDAVARCLTRMGVGVGSLVALLLPRAADTMAYVLGVLKAGAVYAPIPADAPPAVVARMLEACAPAVVLVDTGGARRVEEWSTPASLVVDVEQLERVAESLSIGDAKLGSPGLEDVAMCLVCWATRHMTTRMIASAFTLAWCRNRACLNFSD
jgi:non-ribosomal peptide synthetase component F